MNTQNDEPSTLPIERGPSSVHKIISGGQTGADQGALRAAVRLGLQTGGWAPRGFLTELGGNDELRWRYNLAEHARSEYPPRTRQNVIDSDATIVIGNLASRGSRLTIKLCDRLRRPLLTIRWPFIGPGADEVYCVMLRQFLGPNGPAGSGGVRVLNVAGNRESKMPGIAAAVEEFLVRSLGGGPCVRAG